MPLAPKAPKHVLCRHRSLAGCRREPQNDRNLYRAAHPLLACITSDMHKEIAAKKYSEADFNSFSVLQACLRWWHLGQKMYCKAPIPTCKVQVMTTLTTYIVLHVYRLLEHESCIQKNCSGMSSSHDAVKQGLSPSRNRNWHSQVYHRLCRQYTDVHSPRASTKLKRACPSHMWMTSGWLCTRRNCVSRHCHLHSDSGTQNLCLGTPTRSAHETRSHSFRRIGLI